MTYPQQPGNWPNESWPQHQQPYGDPNQQASGVPASPASGYDASGYPVQYSVDSYSGQGFQAQQPYSAQPYAAQVPAQQGYPGYGYTTPAAAGPMLPPPVPGTNGLAIAALVCSLAGLFMCGAPAIVGAILGHVARRQIRERGEQGDGLALAGIIVGWSVTGLAIIGVVIYVIFFVWLVSTANSIPDYNPTPFPT
jgi:hypothetical protein